MRVILFLAAGAAAVAVEKSKSAGVGRCRRTKGARHRHPGAALDAHAFKQYVASSYVKWVEMAGGVAVPLSYVASNTTTLNLLKQLDGVLLPGGSNLPLPDAARVSVAYALAAASRNESFPGLGDLFRVARRNPGLVEVLPSRQGRSGYHMGH